MRGQLSTTGRWEDIDQGSSDSLQALSRPLEDLEEKLEPGIRVFLNKVECMDIKPTIYWWGQTTDLQSGTQFSDLKIEQGELGAGMWLRPEESMWRGREVQA